MDGYYACLDTNEIYYRKKDIPQDASYRRFNAKEPAELWLRRGGCALYFKGRRPISTSDWLQSAIDDLYEDEMIAVCDASQAPGKAIGCGMVLFTAKQNYYYAFRVVHPVLQKQGSTAAEILAAKCAIEWGIDHGFYGITLLFDNLVILRLASGRQRPRTHLEKAYVRLMDDAYMKHDICFVKVRSHSGMFWHDQVDIMANGARKNRKKWPKHMLDYNPWLGYIYDEKCWKQVFPRLVQYLLSEYQDGFDILMDMMRHPDSPQWKKTARKAGISLKKINLPHEIFLKRAFSAKLSKEEKRRVQNLMWKTIALHYIKEQGVDAFLYAYEDVSRINGVGRITMARLLRWCAPDIFKGSTKIKTQLKKVFQ